MGHFSRSCPNPSAAPEEDDPYGASYGGGNDKEFPAPVKMGAWGSKAAEEAPVKKGAWGSKAAEKAPPADDPWASGW